VTTPLSSGNTPGMSYGIVTLQTLSTRKSVRSVTIQIYKPLRPRHLGVSRGDVSVRVHRTSLLRSGTFTDRHVSIAESRPALKVSFNRPRPRSQPAGPPGVCVGCLFFFTAVRTVVINVFFKQPLQHRGPHPYPETDTYSSSTRSG